MMLINLLGNFDLYLRKKSRKLKMKRKLKKMTSRGIKLRQQEMTKKSRKLRLKTKSKKMMSL